jgi:TetR/AcrR family transcriptional regulator, transcriptional repressor for nem operon
MGRQKNYERDNITRKAMEVFWRLGYHGTSTQSLVDAMGVNRFSLYAEFGSKKALYEAALKLYEEEVVTYHLRSLESPEAGLIEMQDLFNAFANAAGATDSEMGCFVCNAATDQAPYELGSRMFVHAYVMRISAAFTHALNNARQRRSQLPDVNAVQEGHYLATLVVGIFVLLRAQMTPTVLHAAVASAQQHLHYLTGQVDESRAD